ncbi:hypothetical protein M426DRAFT_317947 [Hypoxylon sp. CI-4A]|nr:hypothetical protein M426DRAFT_317947 [Hypoxylon sp. CI-4A]
MDITGNAFVTGGASGIGRASCLAFAKDGAKGLLVADLNLKGAQEVVAEAKALATNPEFRAEAIQIDVADEESVKKVVAHTVQSFGRIDYSLHSAGISIKTYQAVGDAPFDEFKSTLNVHVHGTFLVTSYITKAMKAQELKPVDPAVPQLGGTRGSIVNLGSVTSLFPPPNMVQYTTSKHAVLGITKTAAVDNAPHGIRVNCLCPGWIETPMLRETIDIIPPLNDETITIGTPMNRVGLAKEVADSVIFLSSPRASFITGIELPIDGGMCIAFK